MEKKGLGRGLSSLFGDFDDEDDVKEKKQPESKPSDATDNVREISIGLIDRNEEQPRTNFDPKALDELAASIKVHGIIQPILLNEKDGRYVIVAGERRWRAARLAGLKTVPAIVKNFTNKEISEVAIIENLQREDLNPIESARAIQKLINKFDLTQENVAERIGKSRSAVTNTLRLLSLPNEVIKYIEDGKLSAGHARTLLSIEDKDKLLEIARFCVEKKLSVRELEKLVKDVLKPSKNKEKKPQSLELKDFAEKMKTKFATKVGILGNENKGRIYIDYYTKEDLQRIYDIVLK